MKSSNQLKHVEPYQKHCPSVGDLLAGRYQAFYATKKEDIDGCISVLEEVRRKELNRVSGKSVIESSAFSNAEVAYQLVACRDTKPIR